MIVPIDITNQSLQGESFSKASFWRFACSFKHKAQLIFTSIGTRWSSVAPRTTPHFSHFKVRFCPFRQSEQMTEMFSGTRSSAVAAKIPSQLMHTKITLNPS